MSFFNPSHSLIINICASTFLWLLSSSLSVLQSFKAGAQLPFVVYDKKRELSWKIFFRICGCEWVACEVLYDLKFLMNARENLFRIETFDMNISIDVYAYTRHTRSFDEANNRDERLEARNDLKFENSIFFPPQHHINRFWVRKSIRCTNKTRISIFHCKNSTCEWCTRCNSQFDWVQFIIDHCSCFSSFSSSSAEPIFSWMSSATFFRCSSFSFILNASNSAKRRENSMINCNHQVSTITSSHLNFPTHRLSKSW